MLERLEYAYQQASRFSADASHELRIPLSIVRSELETIQAAMRWTPDQSPLYERIGSILEEIERLSRIVEGLFALARLDAGEARMEHQIFDLSNIVQSTVEQMQLLGEEKQLAISVDAPIAVWVVGDPARLKQVIVNLLDNAIKYTPPHGSVSLSVFTEFQKAILKVHDNGKGISNEALPHVFKRFYRDDKTRSNGAQGAGLGLSIVDAICQAHGGEVRIDSVFEAGTTVTVELPVADRFVDADIAKGK
jgi:signal transduction histidine kinase